MVKSNNKKHIIIVDDDTALLNTLGIVVREFGYSTSLVDDSRKIFLEIDKTYPNLIILDLIMPVLDGEEILKIFKTDKKLSKIPVILLSASNTIEDIAEQNNVAGYIKKPFDLDKLYDLIEAKIL